MTVKKRRIFITGAKTILPGALSDDSANGESMERGYLSFDEPLQVRGAKYLNRSTIIGVSAVDAVLKTGDYTFQDVPQKTGVCLATALGNGNKVAQMASSIRIGGVRELSPMDLPTASINVAAAKIAIDHGLKGINATLTGVVAPSLDALIYGCRAIAAGRTHRMIVVGTEEANECCPIPQTDQFREGAAALLLENEEALASRAVSGSGEVEGWKTGYVHGEDEMSVFWDSFNMGNPVDAVLDCRHGVRKQSDTEIMKRIYGENVLIAMPSKLIGGRPGVDGLIGICEALHRINEGLVRRCAVISGGMDGHMAIVVVSGVGKS